MLFRRLLFGVLLVASATITAEFTLPHAAAESGDPTNTCFVCKLSTCASQGQPTGSTGYVLRCQNHDPDPTGHCCSTYRVEYITSLGGFCYHYDCFEGTSNGF